MENKRYRFEKLVFRIVVIILVIYVMVVGMFYGIKTNYYINCPKESLTPCVNPIAHCRNLDDMAYLFYGCDDYKNFIQKCDSDLNSTICNQEIIQQGSYVGNLPPIFIRSAHLIFLIIIVLGFIFNHLIYNRGGKN